MQVNNELKDILLERNESNGANTKKILLIVAAAVILFLAVVVVMKFINNDPESQSNATAEADSRLVLPPAPNSEQNLALNQPLASKPEQIQNVVIDKKNDEQLFEQVPIILENKSQDDFENMVKRLKDKSSTSANTSEASQKKPKPLNKVEPVVVLKPELKKEEPKKTEQRVQNAPKPETKLAYKPEPIKGTSKPLTSSTKGAYIQVAAISKTIPDSTLISKISAKGYVYTTVKAGNMTKIIVGPFSEDKIQGVLRDIRKDIASGAFIYRVK